MVVNNGEKSSHGKKNPPTKCLLLDFPKGTKWMGLGLPLRNPEKGLIGFSHHPERRVLRENDKK